MVYSKVKVTVVVVSLHTTEVAVSTTKEDIEVISEKEVRKMVRVLTTTVGDIVNFSLDLDSTTKVDKNFIAFDS